jgi:hypothetical protein
MIYKDEGNLVEAAEVWGKIHLIWTFSHLPACWIDCWFLTSCQL